MDKQQKILYFNRIASERDRWKKRSKYYYKHLSKLMKFLVLQDSKVLEIGCGTGDLLNELRLKKALGVDISPEMINVAKHKYPQYEHIVGDAEDLPVKEKYDYVVMSDLLGHLDDIQTAFKQLKKVTTPETRVIITNHNRLWEPFFWIAEKLRLKMPQHYQNWLSIPDIENLLYLAGYEIVKKGERLLLPKNIPIVSWVANKYLAALPGLRRLCTIKYLVAREIPEGKRKDYSVSVIVACRDEEGNIENAVKRLSKLGRETELIFVNGDSKDNTEGKILEMIKKYKGKKDIKLIRQIPDLGKGDAVRIGFDAAKGDILMILDADLTVQPEDLPKFYEPIATGRGEFINGTRLVYPMEEEAMRTLNYFGNKMFSLIFTWLLDQRIKDTLCGTKVLFKKDYERVKRGRSYFGNFDPFGDFDLLFGASKLNLKIVEVPIRYKERVYGNIKIRRFKHGWLLIKMCLFAYRKLKIY